MKKHTPEHESPEDKVAQWRAAERMKDMKDPILRVRDFKNRMLSAMRDSDRRYIVRLRREYNDILALISTQSDALKRLAADELEDVENAFRSFGLLPPKTEQERKELETLLNDVAALLYLEKNYQPGSGREELEVLADMYRALLARIEKAPESVRETIHKSLKDVVQLLTANGLLP